MKMTIYIPIVAFILYGCSTTYTIVEPSSNNPNTKTQFTDQILNTKVTVEFRDGKEVDAIHFEVRSDSCFWIDSNMGYSGAVQTKDIKRVVKRDHLRGALDGLVIGGIGGGTAGGLLGYAFGGSGGDDLATGLGFLAGSFIGGIIGTIYGVSSGHKDAFQFVWLPNNSMMEAETKVPPKEK
jgi:hypothetical protein